MALSQMQPDPHGHENAGRDQRARERLAPEIAQGEHEEHETEAIPKEAEDERRRSARGRRSSAPPATIATIPSATRQSTFSRKANQASNAVKTPSRLRSRDAADAGARTTGRSGRTAAPQVRAYRTPGRDISSSARESAPAAPSSVAHPRARSWRERGSSEVVEQGVRIGLCPHTNLARRREPRVVDVDQLVAVEVDLDVIAAHVRAQRVPDPRCDGHMYALHFDAPAILHVVPADVVLERIRAREVIVVLVLVAPHDTARAIHPTAHRFAPDSYAHVSELGPISHGDGEAVVRPIAVFLREYVGRAGGVGRGANDPPTRAP